MKTTLPVMLALLAIMLAASRPSAASACQANCWGCVNADEFVAAITKFGARTGESDVAFRFSNDFKIAYSSKKDQELTSKNMAGYRVVGIQLPGQPLHYRPLRSAKFASQPATSDCAAISTAASCHLEHSFDFDFGTSYGFRAVFNMELREHTIEEFVTFDAPRSRYLFCKTKDVGNGFARIFEKMLKAHKQ